VLISGWVACTQRHTAEQRCAEWLLRRADQVGGGPFPLTQQLLASVLGLRRTTVSAVAARLQGLGLVTYRYGRLAVQDHEGVPAAATGCSGMTSRAWRGRRPRRPALADPRCARDQPPPALQGTLARR